MASISGSVSTSKPMVARVISKDGTPKGSPQYITPPSGSFSFGTDEGDKVEVSEVEVAASTAGEGATAAA